MTETLLKNTSSAKIVSARIPMVDYIEFLKQATNDNLSITDFLIMKLYQEDKVKELTKALSDKEKKINDLSEEVTERTEYLMGWKKTAEERAVNEKKLQAEVSTLKSQINALKDAENRYKSEINADGKTVSELKSQIAKLQGEKSELLKINGQWVEAYNKLKALGNQVWNEVYKHNKENNVFYDLTLEKIVNKLKS